MKKETIPDHIEYAVNGLKPEADLAYDQAMKYGRDLAEVYKQERAKREALEVAYTKLEGAIAHMTDGFLVVDQDLRVVEANQTCADLFESTNQEIIGKLLAGLLVSQEGDAFCNRLLNASRIKRVDQLSILVPTERTLMVHASPLPAEGWVLILHDITWEERVNNMREEFINLAAHELRTPLSGIIGFASLLNQSIEDETFEEDGHNFLNKILSASERLKDTINDLLDFSISQSQQSDAKLFDLREIVQDTAILLDKQATEHGVDLELDLDNEPTMVFGEEKMLSVAIGHLIENGIRYNKPDGTLTIKGTVTDKAYELFFADTGIGMTQKDVDHIFKPFFQAEEHTVRRSVGMGLGLSIVKRTITLHRGNISVTSERNVGTTVTISLPRFQATNMEAAKSEWLKIQRNLQNPVKKPTVDVQTQALISTLKTQLQVTQSQSLAYAKDLARLYQNQRADEAATKAQEARLSHTDRLAMMGQLAAGVAHDLSNLIGPILGYSQVILRKRDTIDADLVDIIERILNISRRANALLKQMVNLSSAHADKQQTVNLNNLAQETLALLEVKIRHANITLTENYYADLPNVFGSAIQISQIILNIVVNAIDAMPLGGTMTIETGTKGGFIRLKISDTGSGIPPEILPHIFDAFFTTKHENSGTGLGLSISKGIIQAHGGQISVESIKNQGTHFTILLPVSETDV